MGFSSRVLVVTIGVAFFVACAGTAWAGQIAVDDPVFGADALTKDEATGLHWLDVNLTTNKSYNYISGQFGVGGEFEGFRYATFVETTALMTNAGIVHSGFSHIPANYTPVVDLQDLVGLTIGTPSYANPATIAMTGTFTGTNLRRVGIDALHGPPSTGRAFFGTFSAPPSQSLTIIGSWLIRENDPAAPVPEPGTLALLGLGMAGLGWHRRRRMKAS